MPSRSRTNPAEAGWMSIGALSRATGVAVETLRTWERRYGVPSPERKPSGHRLYPSAAVEHLRRIGMLLNRGHRPAELLALPLPELDRLLALTESRPAPATITATAAGETAGGAVDALLQATRALDRERLLRELRAHWTRLGPLRFLDEVAGPFMAAVGIGWKDGSLRVGHEHFASARLADFLREVRAPFDENASGPVAAAAALEGDLHEGGLLMVSALLAVRGWRVIYLGPNTPAAELAELARERTLDAVVLSVSAAVPRARAAKAVRALRARLPRRVELWTGGEGAPAPARRIERFATLAALDERLSRPR
jgi:MerR family transcriptional regulator, light-induced transcriptional regulator